MEVFELILILLACVMISSVIDQVTTHISLPLWQIGVGLVVAIILPRLAEVHLDSEFFLMLFIAPLLFRDSKEVSRITLWNNRLSILSMAIALVIASVLAAGFIMHWIIPSVPLAAAFACAAALGPTDAAAVAAMGANVELTERQSILLSGEALINDASGVVSFQFAVAAAVTGAFSVGSALGTFALLFFGGIAFGIIFGYILKRIMNFLRRRGYVNTTTHVIYEVVTPFVLFLFAEEVHVSGILAVVAAGIVMQDVKTTIKSPELARQEMVSNSFWEVIIFLINGVIFVMLGMQLPKVMHTEAMEGISPAVVIGAMLAITATILIMRFIWVSCLELIHRDPETGKCGKDDPAKTIRQSLVTTIAGPKGAVTLSIIMTLPLTIDDGSAFPLRDLIIFVTSGSILCTLLLADYLLPKLAPKGTSTEEAMDLVNARLLVLEGTVKALRGILNEYPDADFTPAMRLTLMRYRVRLMRERLAMDSCGDVLQKVIKDVLDKQQVRADEIQKESYHIPEAERLIYYSILPSIRTSIGYFGGAEKIGSRFETRKGRMMLNLSALRNNPINFDDEKKARVYYDTVLFAIDLEYTAIKYLQELIEEKDPQTKRVAETLLEEHNAALQSLWGRINYGQEVKMEEVQEIVHGMHDTLPEGMSNNTAEQFRKAWHYNDEADANALQIELEQIRQHRLEGTISEGQAKALREEVYLMQTAFLE